ncbi:hypothetical protein PR048_018478 [Dryococelus australis]|uniref:Uncharacterized protein n=1 Tax=Dryococelus australis TaxID=614101 RepID=A0ABQ9HCI5_9NEOP|nr:hypothetical protein PR048_018478 [Dryococelus australis]
MTTSRQDTCAAVEASVLQEVTAETSTRACNPNNHNANSCQSAKLSDTDTNKRHPECARLLEVFSTLRQRLLIGIRNDKACGPPYMSISHTAMFILNSGIKREIGLTENFRKALKNAHFTVDSLYQISQHVESSCKGRRALMGRTTSTFTAVIKYWNYRKRTLHDGYRPPTTIKCWRTCLPTPHYFSSLPLHSLFSAPQPKPPPAHEHANENPSLHSSADIIPSSVFLLFVSPPPRVGEYVPRPSPFPLHSTTIRSKCDAECKFLRKEHTLHARPVAYLKDPISKHSDIAENGLLKAPCIKMRIGAAVVERLDCYFPPREGEPGSIPCQAIPRSSYVGLAPDDAAGHPLPPHFCSGIAPSSPQSPSSALKTPLLRAAQISSLSTICFEFFSYRDEDRIDLILQSGRPEAFTDKEEIRIVRRLKKNLRLRAPKLCAEVYESTVKKVNPQTIRVIKRAGLNGRVARKKSHVSTKKIRGRELCSENNRMKRGGTTWENNGVAQTKYRNESKQFPTDSQKRWRRYDGLEVHGGDWAFVCRNWNFTPRSRSTQLGVLRIRHCDYAPGTAVGHVVHLSCQTNYVLYKQQGLAYWHALQKRHRPYAQDSQLECSVLVVLRVPMGQFSGDPVDILGASLNPGFRTICGAVQEPVRQNPLDSVQVRFGLKIISRTYRGNWRSGLDSHSGGYGFESKSAHHNLYFLIGFPKSLKANTVTVPYCTTCPIFLPRSRMSEQLAPSLMQWPRCRRDVKTYAHLKPVHDKGMGLSSCRSNKVGRKLILALAVKPSPRSPWPAVKRGLRKKKQGREAWRVVRLRELVGTA